MSAIPGQFDNPFATRWTAPGAIEYLFPDGASIDILIERLAVNNWRGAIVGPHGSGKSTLLASLITKLRSREHDVEHVALHRGERKLPRAAMRFLNKHGAARSDAPADILAIDGWEQLWPCARWRTIQRCRVANRGLVVTCHRDMSPPTIWRVCSSIEQARRVVACLANRHGVRVPLGVIDASFTNNNGDIREMLFSLYDWYERTNPGVRTTS